MITVLMSVYREDVSVVKEALRSLQNQTLSPDQILIMADDPNNVELIEWLKDQEAKDSRIQIEVNPVNMGLSASLNRGLAFAKGEIIARMDADDISVNGRLEKQLSFLESEKLDFVSGSMIVMDQDGNDSYNVGKIPVSHEKIIKALRFGQVMAHPAWMVRKKVFDNLRGYRPVPYAEDLDFTLRAALAGYKMGNLKEGLVQYRMSEGSISRSHLYKQYLYMKYLCNCYSKGMEANLDEMNSAVNKQYKQEKAVRYAKAYNLFNQALHKMTNSQYFSMLKDCIQIAIISPPLINKIYRFGIQKVLYS